MQLEKSIKYLREGKRIYRLHKPDKGSLCATFDESGMIKDVLGSFYMTIYDVLSDDWCVESQEVE